MEMIIDFLIRLVTPMEGADYAIAPIVLAGLAQLPGMIQGMSAAKAAKEQGERDERRAREDKLAAQRALADLRAGKLEFEPIKDKLSERYTDAYEMSMSRAPEQAAREAREQALASSLATGGDPRSMAANMQAALGFSQGSRQDAFAGMAGREAATSTLAGLEQGIANTNRARRQAQFNTERLGAQQLFTASRAQERAAQDAQKEAIRQRNQAMLGAAVGTAGGALQMQGVDKFGDIFKSVPGALSGVGDTVAVGSDIVNKSDGVQGLLSSLSKGTNVSNVPTVGEGVTVPQFDSAVTGYGSGSYGSLEIPDIGGDLQANLDLFRKLALEHGGKVGKTGGEFNHDTNKKALIDEESGEKEAELTGDETMFVFNPKQTSTFEKLINGNDASGLMKFMKQLLKKPQFNK
jgi:hypothetical protein